MIISKHLLLLFLMGMILSCNDSQVAIPLGDREVFMALTPGVGDSDLNQVLDFVLSKGFNGPGDVNIEWGQFENSVGIYNDHDNLLEWTRNNLGSIPINLTLTPIQTTSLVLPEYLHDVAWDDSTLIHAFDDFIGYLVVELEGLEISTIAIGNEVDVFFANDEIAYQQYITFYNAAKEIVSKEWPNAKVGVKLSFDASIRNRSLSTEMIINNSDIGLVTYYPSSKSKNELRDLVLNDFELLTDFLNNKEVHLVEVGFPSSQSIGSSERTQREFVSSIFEAWDLHAQNIPSITFVWLNDISEEVLTSLSELYQSSDPEFIEFLGSLGFRNHDKTEKLAFKKLIEEISLRK